MFVFYAYPKSIEDEKAKFWGAKTAKKRKTRGDKMRVKAKNIITALICAILCAVSSCVTASCSKEQTDDLPKIVIGASSRKPYFYQDENGEYVGIDVEIAVEACRRIGYEPIFKEIDWAQKDELLNDGDVDCLWTCFSMNGRESEYLWAGPYALDRETVAVAKDSNIYSLQDLAHKTIAAQAYSKAEELFLSNDGRLPQMKKVFSMGDIYECVSAFRRGYVDACVGHEAALLSALDLVGAEYRMLNEPILISRMGAAFSLDSDGVVCSALGEAFVEMNKDGTIKNIFRAYGAYLVEERLYEDD